MKITSDGAWLGIRRSLAGMKANARGMTEAADDVRSATQSTLNGAIGLPTDRVDVRGAASLQDGVLDLKLHKHGYSANLKAAQSADETFQSMIDMILPHRSRDDSD